jgi:hypothetical protein
VVIQPRDGNFRVGDLDTTSGSQLALTPWQLLVSHFRCTVFIVGMDDHAGAATHFAAAPARFQS